MIGALSLSASLNRKNRAIMSYDKRCSPCHGEDLQNKRRLPTRPSRLHPTSNNDRSESRVCGIRQISIRRVELRYAIEALAIELTLAVAEPAACPADQSRTADVRCVGRHRADHYVAEAGILRIQAGPAGSARGL